MWLVLLRDLLEYLPRAETATEGEDEMEKPSASDSVSGLEL